MRRTMRVLLTLSSSKSHWVLRRKKVCQRNSQETYCLHDERNLFLKCSLSVHSTVSGWEYGFPRQQSERWGTSRRKPGVVRGRFGLRESTKMRWMRWWLSDLNCYFIEWKQVSRVSQSVWKCLQVKKLRILQNNFRGGVVRSKKPSKNRNRKTKLVVDRYAYSICINLC